jgi:hypothetical protein
LGCLDIRRDRPQIAARDPRGHRAHPHQVLTRDFGLTADRDEAF